MSAATTTSHTPWPTVKLGDVCALKNGYTPKAEELSEQGVIPYFRISAMNFEGNEKRMIKPTAWLVSKKRCFNAGSIVFPKNGGAVYTRKVRVLEHDSVVDLNTGVCTPDKKTIDCEYLYHWFSNLNITDVVVEGTIPFVDFGMLREVFIPLPPLDVQREIVAKVEAGLKEADGLVAHFKRLAALADDTFKAELDETFSTLNAPTVKLGDVCEEIRERISTDAIELKNYITTDNMLKACGGIRLAESLPPNTSLVHYKRGDILLSNIRPYLKKLWHATFDGGCSSDVIVFRSGREDLKSCYLYQVLSQETFFGYVMQNVSGTKMPRGKREWIKEFEFPLPSLDEQARIVARLEAAKVRCERLRLEAERGLKAAEALRKAVLAEAFEHHE